MKWSFTNDDYITAISIFCNIFGVGSLGMPGIFAKAGPYYGSIIFLFTAVTNIYAGICLCRLMSQSHVLLSSLGDIGEYSMGKIGRWLFTSSQLVSLLLVPTAFLILGSIFLDGIFPNVTSPFWWTIIMTTCLLPVVLQPTLKEAVWAAAIGTLAVVCAVVVGLVYLINVLDESYGHTIPPEPSFSTVIEQYGTLGVAYGASCVIPSLYRIHSNPVRMPYVVSVTLGIISLIFISTAIVGYVLIGCQVDGNIIFGLASNSYGVTTPRWVVITGYVGMLIHITMAFGIIIHPALYVIEQYVFPLKPSVDMTKETISIVSIDHIDEVVKDYKTVPLLPQDEANAIGAEYGFKHAVLRTLIVIGCVIVANLLIDRILNLLDFIGAFASGTVNIILPIVSYLMKEWKKISLKERFCAIALITACAIASIYCTYTNFIILITPPSPSHILYPACPVGEYQTTFYTLINNNGGN